MLHRFRIDAGDNRNFCYIELHAGSIFDAAARMRQLLSDAAAGRVFVMHVGEYPARGKYDKIVPG